MVVLKEQDTGSGVSKNGDHSRQTAAIRVYCYSSRQFSALFVVQRADLSVAIACVSLACTNTISSTISN